MINNWHEKLSSRFNWYKVWHSLPFHPAVHWFLFLIVVASTGVFLNVTIGNTYLPRASASISMLTANDLTFLGQVNTPGTLYVGQNLAMRYVNGERRFLVFEYNNYAGPQGAEWVGDLVEYRVTAPLKNGNQHWTDANVPGWTEVRRWKNWTTISRMKAMGTWGVWKEAPYYNSGVMPAGFYWDEEHGVLWYSLLLQYSPNSLWPAWNAVKLTDADAGGNVSNSNIYGPFYFKDNTTVDLFKDSSSGMTPIPVDRQAEMGGTHILEGHHSANIGSRGARSVGFWVINGLPDPATLAPNSVLWPGAYHLYDTSSGSGKPAPNMHKPNFAKNSYYHGGNSNFGKLVTRGVVSDAQWGNPVGVSVDDAIYVSEEPYVYLDTISVYMTTGASGGAWVPEIYNGSAWVQPPGWAVSVGDTELSGAENVFYWPKVAYSYDPASDRLINNGGYGYRYVRLRRTSPGTSGGAIATILATISMVGQTYGPDNNLTLPGTGYVGGYVRPGSGTPQYDASHYSYSFVDQMYGGAWVKTSAVEGFAYFGAVSSGGYAYGPLPVYAQPETGGVPIKYEAAGEAGGLITDGWSNGPRYEGPEQPYFLPFASSDLVAAAADPSKRFSDFLNPASYSELYSTFPGLISQYRVTSPRVSGEGYFGAPFIYQYYVGASTVFDPVTNQLIVMMPSYNRKNILAFFQVRGEANTPEPTPTPTPEPEPTPTIDPLTADSAWQSAWIAKVNQVVGSATGKLTGKTIHIGDSLTVSCAYGSWAQYGTDLTDDELATKHWLHADEQFSNNNGWAISCGSGSAVSGGTWGDSWIDGVFTNPYVGVDAQYAVWLFNSVPDMAIVQHRIDQSLAAGIVPILTTVPPRIATNAPNYDDIYTKPFNTRLKALAQQNSIPIIDLFSAIDPETMLSSDGVHFNLAGYNVRTQLTLRKMAQIKAHAIASPVSAGTPPSSSLTPTPEPEPTPTLEPTPSHSAPTISNKGISIQTGTVTITWNTDIPATSQLDYGINTNYSSQSALNSSVTTAHSRSITNLTPGNYHYRAVSVANSLTTNSSDGTFTIRAKPPAPTNISVTPGSIILNWTNPNTDGFSGTAILRSTTGYITTYDANAQIATTDQNTYHDVDVTAGTKYYYSLFAYDDQGNYSDPATVSFTAQETLSNSTNNTSGSSTSSARLTGTGSARASLGSTRVMSTTQLNVRVSASPTAPIVKIVPQGIGGTIIYGPVTKGGYTWYQVKYDNGVTGYSVQNYLNIIGTTQSAGSTVSPQVTNLTEAQKQTLIAAIKAQLQILIKQLNELIAKQGALVLQALQGIWKFR